MKISHLLPAVALTACGPTPSPTAPNVPKPATTIIQVIRPSVEDMACYQETLSLEAQRRLMGQKIAGALLQESLTTDCVNNNPELVKCLKETKKIDLILDKGKISCMDALPLREEAKKCVEDIINACIDNQTDVKVFEI